VHRKASKTEICLGVLLQLPLLSLTGPMLGLGNIQEMQQLRILVKNMKVIIKMMSALQLIHLQAEAMGEDGSESGGRTAAADGDAFQLHEDLLL
jgi:hypothetical protein